MCSDAIQVVNDETGRTTIADDAAEISRVNTPSDDYPKILTDIAKHPARASRSKTNLKRQVQRLRKTVLRLRLSAKLLRHENVKIRKAAHKRATGAGGLFPTNRRYDAKQRKFAKTLRYHSASAYDFMRKAFKLPCPRTIRNYLSTVNVDEGITHQSLETIRLRLEDDDEKVARSYRICALMVDEMDIKKQLQYDRLKKTVHGFTTTPDGSSTAKQATKVFVIMAVSLGVFWKLPIGYWFTDGANGDFQYAVVKEAIEQLHAVGCVVVSLTFDGAANNVAMLQRFGASCKPGNLRCSFPHPCDTALLIMVVFDPPHMLKLIRNLLAAYGSVCVPGYGTAQWDHIVKLYKTQKAEKVMLANKLTREHVQFHNQIMKVKLAAQVFSSSVASALKALRLQNHVNFQDTKGTERLLKDIDRLFDVLNSKACNGSRFKGAISVYNLGKYSEFLRRVRDRLLALTLVTGVDDRTTETNLTGTKRRMGILGFCISIDSVLGLANSLFAGNGVNGFTLNYLLTYRLCQDHLEMFFSSIRRRCGNNHNPTCQQFRWAYRAILSHCDVAPSPSANVTLQHEDATPNSWRKSLRRNEEFFPLQSASRDHDYSKPFDSLKPLVVDVCAYVAGRVAQRLRSAQSCARCVAFLLHPPYMVPSSLLEVKNRGSLTVPSAALVHVVCYVEQHLRWALKGNLTPQTLASLSGDTLRRILLGITTQSWYESLFAEQHGSSSACHRTECDISSFDSLMQSVIESYVDIRAFYLTNSFNCEEPARIGLRPKLTHNLTQQHV